MSPTIFIFDKLTVILENRQPQQMFLPELKVVHQKSKNLIASCSTIYLRLKQNLMQILYILTPAVFRRILIDIEMWARENRKKLEIRLKYVT